MPRRSDIDSICILGSGPIIIGQAAEFDYSGTQAIRALKKEGFRVTLINSNPATIMTDPELADATYIEPMTPEFVARILEKERPQALLPTMGGQTALNIALALHEDGTLERLGIEMLAASPEVIHRAEDRQAFSATMTAIGVDQPRGTVVRSMKEAWAFAEEIGFPNILRPSFTMGGSGGNIAYNREEFAELMSWALAESPTHEVLLDESLLGWKEYELELVRDKNDQIVIVCGIENIDPLGVHTGDSVTIAPIQTLSDADFQAMCEDAYKIIRAVGVEAGGCNIQFGVCPKTGRRVVIEMNPRVSRSSALASKATGYPIAKIAALLAVGYTLEELAQDLSPAQNPARAPQMDFVAVKIPRFTFEKFPGADTTLSTQMKSVGEVMSLGRSFPEALGKAVRSLEINHAQLRPTTLETPADDATAQDIRAFYAPRLQRPTPERLWYVLDALRRGMTGEEINALSAIDAYFLEGMSRITDCEEALRPFAERGELPPRELLLKAKQLGISDVDLAQLFNRSEEAIREYRHAEGVRPIFKRVDTTPIKSEAPAAYFYSSYEQSESQYSPDPRPSIMILGSGPNRIGQGIEFDYCSVHAALALREAGYRTIMVNCNPETVSTDTDISDRLYFEPLTLETVLELINIERPQGVILQFGGQTPLKLARGLSELKIPLLGTSADAIDRTEDRKLFGEIVEKLGLRQPEPRSVTTWEEAQAVAEELDFPLMVRPSFVLGGLAMEIAYDETSFQRIFRRAHSASAGNPVLIDRFLNRAVEIDVDLISDGENAIIGGIMEHIEEAGAHSGDSASVLPPHDLPEVVIREIRQQTIELAKELKIIGLMNVQFAVQDRKVYILEVNPRASRTVPFVSKATNTPLAGLAARVMAGEKLPELGLREERIPPFFSVKESVLPFDKFADVDIGLGPEMRSTGECMGIDTSFEMAFFKAQVGSDNEPPQQGTVFISVKDNDKWASVPIAQALWELGFEILATHGTAAYLEQNGVKVEAINKVTEGAPHIVDAIVNDRVDMVINTTSSARSIGDSQQIRRAAIRRRIPYFTTLAAANGAVGALQELESRSPAVRSLQEYQELLTP